MYLAGARVRLVKSELPDAHGVGLAVVRQGWCRTPAPLPYKQKMITIHS